MFLSNWKDFSIRKKLTLGFGSVILLMLVLGATIGYLLFNLKVELRSLANNYIPSASSISKVERHWRESMDQMLLFEQNQLPLLATLSVNNYQKTEAALTDFVNLMVDQKATLLQNGVDLDLLVKLSREYRVLLDQYVTGQLEANQYLASASRAYNEMYSNGPQAITHPLIKEIGPLYGEVMMVAGGGNFLKMKPLVVRAESLHKRAESFGKGGSATAITGGLTRYLHLADANRMNSLKRYEKAKELTWEIRAASDIGLDNIKVMGDNSSRLIAFQQSAITYSLLFLVVLAVISVVSLTRAIVPPILNSIRQAELLAGGDLSVSFSSNRKDEVGRLESALNTMVGSLRNVVEEITSSSVQIINNSSKLTQGASELADGASEQASSAEEVSSSMEQMHSNILQNTENAQRTESIASKAANSMEESAVLSRNASELLQSITQKIRVISDIAFQTNILALNAAVEAARAGHEGRGFAVVAAEVRRLAERSQEAAADINKASRETFDAASTVMNQINEIAPEIKTTAGLVQEISVASMEQVSGVEQINNALYQLNNVTQQNASNAEEISMAARELDELSGRLSNAIQMFHGISFKVDTPQKRKVDLLAGPKIRKESKRSTMSVPTSACGVKFDLGDDASDSYESF